MHQMGMRVGIPNAGQLNALETLNIRGERSVTCKGAFDAHPSTGPLPAGAPAACEAFRKQPDALERAAELDAQYGRNPDLAALPMYCVVDGVQGSVRHEGHANDGEQRRRTSRMDVPPFDSTIVARLRAKGAIIYAKSVAHEFNGGPGDPGGHAQSRRPIGGGRPSDQRVERARRAIRTTRSACRADRAAARASRSRRTSSTIGICEQTGASCQGPASRNGIATLLATKGIMPDSGGIGNQWFIDRAGIHARTLADAAKVLDAVKDPSTGLLRLARSIHGAAEGADPEQPYASFAVNDGALASGPKPLHGHAHRDPAGAHGEATPNHEAISDQIDREIKTVLRDKLGAELR